MIKKAMILAAGFGKRVHPLTLKNPKPLLRIGNETLLSNTLKFLEMYEIKEVVINVHYLGEQIINYIKNKKFNLTIKIINESNYIVLSFYHQMILKTSLPAVSLLTICLI